MGFHCNKYPYYKAYDIFQYFQRHLSEIVIDTYDSSDGILLKWS